MVDGQAYTPEINGNQLTLTVTKQLSYSATIQISPPPVMSEPGVPSSAASWVSGVPPLSFTTGAQPVVPPLPPTPPQLTVLTPAFGAGSLPIESLVLQATASADVVLGAHGEVSVVGSVGVASCTFPGTASSVVVESANTLILQNIGSTCELRPDTEYTVSLSAGFVVTTAGAAPSAAAEVWKFTTMPEVASDPVTIDNSMTLQNIQDANGFVKEDAPITLHFSAPVFVSSDCAVTSAEAQPTCFVSITALTARRQLGESAAEAWIPIVPHDSYGMVASQFSIVLSLPATGSSTLVCTTAVCTCVYRNYIV